MKSIMYTFAAFAALGALTTPAPADEQADRASLVGSWVENGGNRGWVIENSNNGLHVTQLENSAPVADFSCATDGHDCEVKISGHKAKVSMYYNGAALVQLETKGDQIVKRRFSATGNSMKVQITPMTGKVTTEEREFERGQTAARK